MIEYNDKIRGMLSNILDKTNSIKTDLEYNGKSHHSYMREKIDAIIWDVNVLNNIIKKAEEENEND